RRQASRGFSPCAVVSGGANSVGWSAHAGTVRKALRIGTRVPSFRLIGSLRLHRSAEWRAKSIRPFCRVLWQRAAGQAPDLPGPLRDNQILVLYLRKVEVGLPCGFRVCDRAFPHFYLRKSTTVMALPPCSSLSNDAHSTRGWDFRNAPKPLRNAPVPW